MTILLLVLIIYQLWVKSAHFTAFSSGIFSRTEGYLVLVICLMPVNWWLETLKWRQFLPRHSTISFASLF
ncbi:MAG: hypothetical protein M3R25_09755, partial [Bacteroidota bacterium]|nr:hypothetical protein [Bacteroidota bacterium]